MKIDPCINSHKEDDRITERDLSSTSLQGVIGERVKGNWRAWDGRSGVLDFHMKEEKYFWDPRMIVGVATTMDGLTRMQLMVIMAFWKLVLRVTFLLILIWMVIRMLF